MKKAVIVSGARTAIGSFGGAVQSVRAVDLGAAAIAEAVTRASITPEQVGEVIMGNVLQAGLGQNPARQAAFKAGLPVGVITSTINKVCGSGLQAVVLAAQAIKTGDADVVIAGGMENMSRAPFILDKARYGYRLGDGKLADCVILDGLTDAYSGCHMAITAEGLAEKYDVSRAEQDAFAARSQERWATAAANGKFDDEIVPVTLPQRKGEPIVFQIDEFPRPGTSVETLGRLRPAFKEGGTVTAGNASGINDGAAAVVVMSVEKAEVLGLTPMAEIVSYAVAGVEPSLMGIGPVSASRKALARAGLAVEDIDLIELNEAFAAQAISVNREMGWDESKLNVNGGAIAMGHPIGASGTRILITLLYEMMRRKARYGLATLCIGGGEGIAMIVKR